MNVPPRVFISVPHEALQEFVSRVAQRVGMPEDKANLLAELLVANDLRGVFSHGSQQIANYARALRDGHLNPNPHPFVVSETPTSVFVDGDGGLGYFPTVQGTLTVIEKAKANGIAISLTRNHGHIGAAGIYSRMTLEHNLLSFVTSGHQLGLAPGQPIQHAGGGSPMSFSTPTNEDPIVVDFGTMVDLYKGSPAGDEIARLAPGVVLRAIGLGAICQTWGAMLAGVPFDPKRAVRKWSGANQGSLVIAFRIDLFVSPEAFKRETTEYAHTVRTLTPLEGFDASYLPGWIEAERSRRYRKEGIPVGEGHQRRLEEIGDELGIPVPWKSSH